MITLRYDAFNGEAYRDGEADLAVAIAISSQPNHNAVLCTATSNVLHALRCAFLRGEVDLEDVEIVFCKPDDMWGPAYERNLRLYRDGGILPWPEGFADYEERWLLELLERRPRK